MHVNFQKTCYLLSGLCLVLGGCSSTPYNRMMITDYRSGGQAAEHYEDFTDAYYRLANDGTADIILRKSAPLPQDPRAQLQQIVHLRAVWKPFPGRTHAESSMINTQICYAIISTTMAVSYEGGGFMDYSPKTFSDVVVGKLEAGDLQPTRRSGAGLDIFNTARISGHYRVTRDDRKVTRLINEINRALGDPPRYEPDRSAPVF
ncbi:MAG: hypothetical protein HJJLKODD_01559 [Phycisphaerae bacterium]|nr:hypothetical protein [Phycisphaerae bacterium]